LMLYFFVYKSPFISTSEKLFVVDPG